MSEERETDAIHPADSRHEHAPRGDAGAASGHAENSGGRHEGHSAGDFRRRFWVSSALTIPILAVSPGLPLFGSGRLISVPGADWFLLALSSVLYVYGGSPFLKGAASEVRRRTPGMMTLVAVAITAAYAYSAATVLGLEGMPLFWEFATLIDVMLLGHWIEMRSVAEASSAIESLAKLMPSHAHRRSTDGRTVDVPLQQLHLGDTVVIKPGERIPADGVVTEGDSAVDESMLTGESVPVAKRTGDKVLGGALNTEGALVVRVTQTGSGSFLAQVVDLVKQAQASRTRTQDLADRAAMWLTVVALSAGLATLTGWLLAGKPLAYAMERAVTVMVIACPHALGLAIPLVVAVSTSLGAERGLLVRSRSAFESARLIDTVVFDKTGTLTLGTFAVTDVVTLGHMRRDDLLALAASVETLSEHSIARAIVAAAPDAGQVEEFRAIPGQGATGRLSGREVAVVSLQSLREAHDAVPAEFEQLAAAGRSVVIVLGDGAPLGAIALSDVIRPESAAAVETLRAMGIESVMLTGDGADIAEQVASQLGIERFYSAVRPADKAAIVDRIRSEGRSVAMVGDGINDAPALATADVGIAIGSGTDVAVNSADVVLVRSDPGDVSSAIALARATYRKMVQNLAWATGYNVIAIPLAAGVFAGVGVLLSPAAGAALMSASTVVVALNARTLRLPRA